MSKKHLAIPTLPEGVTIQIWSSQLRIAGSLGAVIVDLRDWFPETTSTYQALVHNAIKGVSQGFVKKLRIQGSGYRILESNDDYIILKLGYSHTVQIPIPQGLTVRYNKYNQVLCAGIDKQQVSEFSKYLQQLRKPNFYKQKGIFPVGQIIPLKLPGKPGLIYQQ